MIAYDDDESQAMGHGHVLRRLIDEQNAAMYSTTQAHEHRNARGVCA